MISSCFKGETDLDPLSEIPIYDFPFQKKVLGYHSLDPTSAAGTRFPSPSLRAGKSVRFLDRVTVYETFSAADYPARSRLAPDDPEMDAPTSVKQLEGEEGGGQMLSLLLNQREAKLLLNLRDYLLD
jgi:hypothetical protein